MGVVINDMEVTPQPPAQEAGGQGQAGDDSGKDPMKLMEKKLHIKRARMHRLEAY